MSRSSATTGPLLWHQALPRSWIRMLCVFSMDEVTVLAPADFVATNRHRTFASAAGSYSAVALISGALVAIVPWLRHICAGLEMSAQFVPPSVLRWNFPCHSSDVAKPLPPVMRFPPQ